MQTNKKYIFVTGGVLSGVGKGITAASIGALLKSRGRDVSIQKCDPYLNVDAGMLNPDEHGECFVTMDGAETDLDLGHYERFLDIETTQDSATLSGRLYSELLSDERAGKFGGKTVQIVPHFTAKIQDAIAKAATGDVHIVEIGGTVGDYESLSFVEAIREMATKLGRENCAFVHVVYIPYLGTSKELKTKPAQNAVRDLRSFGIVPDMIMARAEQPMDENLLAKLAMFGGVERNAVVGLPNAKTIYDVPLTLAEAGADKFICKRLSLNCEKSDLSVWREIVREATTQYSEKVKIGLVAKYLGNVDTYYSVVEALRTAAATQNLGIEIVWIDAEKASHNDFAHVDGILVPGGFGSRGVDGKIAAADFALRNNIPYLGICLGLQVAVIAAARNGGIVDATSLEFDAAAKNPVVYLMNDQNGKVNTGGTMRLGNYPAKLAKNSKIAKIYENDEIIERHRHRFEVNRDYEKEINDGGLVISGTSPDGKLVEFVESPDAKFFVATQAHPEFRSRPNRAHPLFAKFIAAAKR